MGGLGDRSIGAFGESFTVKRFHRFAATFDRSVNDFANHLGQSFESIPIGQSNSS